MESLTADEVGSIYGTLSAWQRDEDPVPLHPGDVGWFCRLGEERTAAALRTWERAGEVTAVGILDEPDVLRLIVAPGARDDSDLAEAILGDLSDPGRGVFPAGSVALELRHGGCLRDLIVDRGWQDDEAWTPLRRDLADPVEDPGLRVEVVQTEQVADRVAVQRGAFANSTFSEDRWHAMADAAPYRHARCLVAYDDEGNAVSAATVWSAGEGRPGLIEPLGTHRDHRGRGYGRGISLACAAALREMGSSSAFVCTPSSNTGGVATYKAAGYEELPAVTDLRRPV